MTDKFLPELKRLMDARALGGFGGVDAENELQGYLLNHAPALAELVEAAEKLRDSDGTFTDIGAAHEVILALAKLNANDVNDVNDGGKHEG